MYVDRPQGWRYRQLQRRGTQAGTPYRRLTDRVEDGAAWLLASAALLIGLVGFVSGQAAFNGALEQARIEAADRIPMRVVLLDAAEVPPSAGAVAVSSAVELPARWIAPDGSERVGVVGLASWAPAGTELTQWVDRAGRPVPPPAGSLGVTVAALMVAVGPTLMAWLVLAALWWRTCCWTAARNAANWARQWRRVEPLWSGRSG